MLRKGNYLVSIAAAKRLCAAVMAWMSPVMCKLNSSGMQCARPMGGVAHMLRPLAVQRRGANRESAHIKAQSCQVRSMARREFSQTSASVQAPWAET